ncbi:MAG TPA: carboxynorspermidine decarboxylase [Desulfovibrio sp.]|uniref:carboxynorspermidine decarboxylase n=1 Tax=Desulfovibrio sp. TaxID=885 RepID=UPI002A4C43A5|nr:carboxynorspermidine decarboxylase [Desulfovibrio sp.]MDY0306086.1 carboxynorspermidine decarboxylase [Desulfovibrionaceae bacterium]HMM38347.1 carboxynorspermidine decarboxylase [Desulfovibrio sp.]
MSDAPGFDPRAVPSPCFLVDAARLRANAAILERVRAATGCRILLALKAFAMWSAFGHLRWALDGVCASSPNEARLGREEFGGEVHAFAAAYSPASLAEIVRHADHVVFNSLGQLERLRPVIETAPRRVGLALRVHPGRSEGHTPIYDPCAPGSRLGILREELGDSLPEGVEGLHFHALCQHGADALERILTAFEERFARFLPGLSYVNFGGGHHITRPGYDLGLLTRLIRDFQERHGLRVYLEPGEAAALDAGFLVAEVLDVVERGTPQAILDTAVPCHMPDVLEMPYRPHIVGSGLPGEKPFTYRLGGVSCLAGDVAGDYSFDRPLAVGDRLVFTDMAIYSMVKTNTFNGVDLPAILLLEPGENEPHLVRSFGYPDFKERLS